jgi:hypothetical protein
VENAGIRNQNPNSNPKFMPRTTTLLSVRPPRDATIYRHLAEGGKATNTWRYSRDILLVLLLRAPKTPCRPVGEKEMQMAADTCRKGKQEKRQPDGKRKKKTPSIRASTNVHHNRRRRRA